MGSISAGAYAPTLNHHRSLRRHVYGGKPYLPVRGLDRHLNLRVAARRGRDVNYVTCPKWVVLRDERTRPPEQADLNLALIVLGGAEDFRILARRPAPRLKQRGEDAADGFQPDVFDQHAVSTDGRGVTLKENRPVSFPF